MELTSKRKPSLHENEHQVHVEDLHAMEKTDFQIKKFSSRLLIVIIIDLASFVMCLLNNFLWDSINTNLLNGAPLKNYVTLNLICTVLKGVIFIIGLLGIYSLFKSGKSSLLCFYGNLRSSEFCFISTLKFVYSIGLFNFAYQNIISQTHNEKFNSFVLVFSIYIFLEFIVYFFLGLFLCKQIWNGINKINKNEVKERQAELIDLHTNLNTF